MSRDTGFHGRTQRGTDPRFIADRMLGPLTRYLRFMGYDTTSANGLAPGNPREDTLLLDLARQDHRILLTRDVELAARGKDQAVCVQSEDVMEQVQQLVERGMIERRLVLCRCSLCNTPLRQASPGETAGAEYAPRDRRGKAFYWCTTCRKLYWNGSHGRNLGERIRGPEF